MTRLLFVPVLAFVEVLAPGVGGGTPPRLTFVRSVEQWMTYIDKDNEHNHPVALVLMAGGLVAVEGVDRAVRLLDSEWYGLINTRYSEEDVVHIAELLTAAGKGQVYRDEEHP